MLHTRGSTTALAVSLLVFVLALGSGCGIFSGSKEPASEVSQPASPPPPAPTPATPPPPPRPTGGKIANEEQLNTLVQGKTTKAEVRELFGIPQEIVLSPGVETFLYFREQTFGFFSRTTERVEMLTVRFDSRGMLKDFEYRYSGK